MDFDAVLIPPRRAAMVAQGFWHDRTINDDLGACVASCPDKLALSALSVESATVTRFTYREMEAMADRIAVGLSRLGIGRNDVVSMQLPNWWQFTLTYLACSHRRRPQSSDAYFPGARAFVHAEARRQQGRDRAEAIPRLRP